MNKYFNVSQSIEFSAFCPDIKVPKELLRVWRIQEEKGSIRLEQMESDGSSFGSFLVSLSITTINFLCIVLLQNFDKY